MTTERENETTEARDTGQSGGADAGRHAGGDSVDGLRAQLEEEREKAQSFYASWQRSAADFQNYKRRVEEERSETARLANAALVINLLPIMDDLERALNTVDAHLAGLTWVDGIRLIHRKFQAVLDMAGVQEIEADGRMFDPAQHEAVSQGPGDEGKVIAVVQKGYRLGDRVIRPAMVVVGSGEGEVKELEAQ
ncbi:MAG TPA: nucleotide exchange factor GrpE [Dehalococcoidia bacterium]|nr:nucleotide exchange factor GrpE [Dehalococcoidia bacterium]